MNPSLIEKPHLYVLAGTTSDVDQYVTRLRYESESRLSIQMLRGGNMQDWDGFYNEVAAALQFPLYFGRNWAALDECLADLEWLGAMGCVLVFVDAPMILKSSGEDDASAFFKLLTRISNEWTEGMSSGPKRQPRPFHVLLHVATDGAEQFAKRVESAINLHVPVLPLAAL